jgi:Protein of unknown function (DUF669)
MAFLKQDNKRAKENDKGFGVIPEGDYELLPVEAKFRDDDKQAWPNINVTFAIRSDVEQEAKGRKVFHTFWLSQKNEDSLQICLNMIESYNEKIGVPDGVEFETPADWANFLVGKPVKARIVIEEYKGKEQNNIKWFNASDFKQVAAQSTPGQAAGTEMRGSNVPPVDADPFANDGQLDISDDDLPF